MFDIFVVVDKGVDSSRLIQAIRLVNIRRLEVVGDSACIAFIEVYLGIALPLPWRQLNVHTATGIAFILANLRLISYLEKW